MSRDATIDLPKFPYSRQGPLDPPPEFASWRMDGPVTAIELWNGRRAWVVTRYEDARNVFRNHELFSSSPMSHGFPTLSATDEASFSAGLLIALDRPKHEALRSAVRKWDDYLPDHLHLNGPGHQRAAADVVAAVRQRTAPPDQD